MKKEFVLKWRQNTMLFFAPAALVFLTVIQSGGTLEDAFIAIYLWMLNTAIDLLKKFLK
jgi:hypothetical protein